MSKSEACIAAAVASPAQPLPVLRIPMTGQDRELYAYEIVFQGSTDSNEGFLQQVLSTITDGALTRLSRGNRAFLKLPAELLSRHPDVLMHQPRLGVLLDPQVAQDPVLMKSLHRMADRGCQLMLDMGALDPVGSLATEALLQTVQFARLDAGAITPDALRARATYLNARGVWVIVGGVDNHEIHGRCKDLPIEAIQGRHLLIPEPVAVPVLTTSRLSMLRLMAALREANPGPVELGAIIRNDAVLSYKLLSCVNSAYFSLPRQLKSVQHAAIFFGVNRMRNWIDTMALCSMDDSSPELLRTALIRAQMCEKLATGMPHGGAEMAFTVGLFSLLDTLMSSPMDVVLEQLRLAPEISMALTERRGAFGLILDQVLAWETGQMNAQQNSLARIQRMARIYLDATQWADQIYASASSNVRVKIKPTR